MTLGPVSDGRFASIVSKNSFPLLTENSQSRWCVSLAPMGGTTLITAKTDAGNSDVLQSVAAALIRLHSTFGRFSAPLDFRLFKQYRAQCRHRKPFALITSSRPTTTATASRRPGADSGHVIEQAASGIDGRSVVTLSPADDHPANECAR